MFMLDTNVISDIVRNPTGNSARRAMAEPDREFGISVIVAAEIRYGIAQNPSQRNAKAMTEVLSAVRVFPFEKESDVEYGNLRAAMSRAGKSLSQNDMLIAAHALALDATLVTDDGAFVHVPGLKTENWLGER
jgi:tRNA(fMet)-specific endonuclease VapC